MVFTLRGTTEITFQRHQMLRLSQETYSHEYLTCQKLEKSIPFYLIRVF